MNLAILHYHLRPGGVTRVIANHILSLDRTIRDGERLRVLLLFDGQRDGWPEDFEEQLTSTDVIVRGLPSLGYTSESSAGSVLVRDDLVQCLSAEGFSPEQTVLHAHNHSLGKNAQFSAALRELAERGYAVLLQPHDFAEDFRPANYRNLRQAFRDDHFSNQVYFLGPRVHYATLNRRDFEILAGGGVHRERLHFLPNPVSGVHSLPSPVAVRKRLQTVLGVPVESEYVLYPVRGIRRKNVGEFVLLSVLRNHRRDSTASDRTSLFGITLAPQNPDAIPYYDHWRQLVDEVGLPCRFGVGQESGLSFPENLAAADRIVTTSVAEGFGMVFLESWLAGRGLVGRNLPEITSDFIEAGLRLEALYDRLNVPLDWIGKDRLVHVILDACQHAYADFGLKTPSPADVDHAVDQLAADGSVDFGILNETLQQAIIRRVAGDTASAETVLDVNPPLQQWESLDEPMIAANRAVVQEEYSLGACGNRLWEIYRSVLDCSPASLDGAADADAILGAFLSLDRFRLIRT